MDIPSHSNLRNPLEDQGELPLIRPVRRPDVSLEVIMRRKTMTGAIVLAYELSGLEDKELCIPLKLDPSHWTKIKKGEAHFPIDKLNEFCDLVGNDVALIWWARSRGFGLHMLETEAERLLRIERAGREKAEAERDLLRGLITGKAA